jgi:hypothetical protein
MESHSRRPEATTAHRPFDPGAATPAEAAASLDEVYDELESRLDNLAEFLVRMDAAVSRLEADLASCAGMRPAPARRTSSAGAGAGAGGAGGVGAGRAASPQRPKRRRRRSAAARRRRGTRRGR